MEFAKFMDRVNRLILKAGGGISVRFSTDPEKGKFIAECSDGTTITGNPTNLKVTVRFGDGHQALASI